MIQQKSIELVAWQSNGTRQKFELNAGQSLLVGKSSNCGVQLRAYDISDIHCRIGFEGGCLWVQDWNSATGTKVNGAKVTAKTQFGQGSVVEIGGYRIQISKADRDRLQDDEQDVGSQQTLTNDEAERSAGVANEARNSELFVEHSTATSSKHENDSRKEEVQIAAAEDNLQANAWGSSDESCFEDEDIYDRETVELLLAEIEDLRTALAHRDSDRGNIPESHPQTSSDSEVSEKMLLRMQDLAEEANRADERVLLLEEMLHAAEDANRSEVEERTHLEAWVGDIEKRLGQREEEHAAELEAMQKRIESAEDRHTRLQRQLQQECSNGDGASQRFEETMESLQQENVQLKDTLAEAENDLRKMLQKYANQSEQAEVALREERAKIAKEHAEMSRMKFEFARKIKELEESPKPESVVDPRLQNLHEHRQFLREMSEVKKEQQQHTLSGRLKRLWQTVE